MRRLMLCLLPLLFVGVTLAQEKAKDEVSRADQFKAIAKSSRDEANEWIKKIQGTTDKAERKAAIDGYQAVPKKYAAKMLELAKVKPDDDTACDAAIWLVQSVRDGTESKDAIELIRKHHIASPKMATAVMSINMALGKAGPEFLEEVFQKNPDKKVKAMTQYTLANSAMDGVQDYLTAEKEIPVKVADATKRWERVANEYGDVEWGRGTLGDMAKNSLAMLKTFSPGCTAPELVGEDTEGKPLKLSDYKGKVIMLDFWGTWCGPCMQMVPHNIETVKKFEGKPFVLIGVNSDKDKVKLAERITKEKINYRSFWNGEKAAAGPISEEWKVQGWPTVVLIDHTGVIRRRFLGSPDTAEEFKGLDSALEKMVQAASSKASR